jgi:hypothetical protein
MRSRRGCPAIAGQHVLSRSSLAQNKLKHLVKKFLLLAKQAIINRPLTVIRLIRHAVPALVRQYASFVSILRSAALSVALPSFVSSSNFVVGYSKINP